MMTSAQHPILQRFTYRGFTILQGRGGISIYRESALVMECSGEWDFKAYIDRVLVS